MFLTNPLRLLYVLTNAIIVLFCFPHVQPLHSFFQLEDARKSIRLLSRYHAYAQALRARCYCGFTFRSLVVWWSFARLSPFGCNNGRRVAEIQDRSKTSNSRKAPPGSNGSSASKKNCVTRRRHSFNTRGHCLDSIYQHPSLPRK